MNRKKQNFELLKSLEKRLLEAESQRKKAETDLELLKNNLISLTEISKLNTILIDRGIDNVDIKDFL